MRKRNTQFKYGKHTGGYYRFKTARNKFVAELRQAKKSYFAKLNPNDQKSFWKTVKKLNKSSCSIPTLFHSGVSASRGYGQGQPSERILFYLLQHVPPSIVCGWTKSWQQSFGVPWWASLYHWGGGTSSPEPGCIKSFWPWWHLCKNAEAHYHKYCSIGFSTV